MRQTRMVLKLKIAAFCLAMIYGIWLAFNVEPRIPVCAGSRMLLCIQK